MFLNRLILNQLFSAMINSHTHRFLYLLLSEQSQPFENDSIAHLRKKTE